MLLFIWLDLNLLFLSPFKFYMVVFSMKEDSDPLHHCMS